jgi:hypothetical protein
MKKLEIIKFCAFCSDQFITSRPTASYCCNSCRTKACVQRKLNEQVKADLEAQRKLAEEHLKQKADARRLKREQKAELNREKQEEQAAKDRRDADAKSIQDEIDAFETTKKNRLINSIVEMLQINAEAKEKQLLADKQRKKDDDIIRIEKEMKKAKERGEMIGKGFAEIIKNLSNLINNTGNKTIQPGTSVTPTLLPKPEMQFQPGQTTLRAPATNPVRKSIAEDILDQLKIF